MELAELFSRDEENESSSGPSTPVECSNYPDAPMNLILRFETASGPRTVIACSVPRQVAAEIRDIMKGVGQHAEFVDRCSPLSVSDRLMIKNLH